MNARLIVAAIAGLLCLLHLRLGFSAGNLTVILPGPALAVLGVVAGCGAVALMAVAALHRGACRPHMRTAT